MDNRLVKLKENIEVTDFEDQTIVFNQNSEHIHVLNNSATIIFKFIHEPRFYNEILAMMSELYNDVDTDILNCDLDELITLFANYGLLETG